jgi:hypothetical protein
MPRSYYLKSLTPINTVSLLSAFHKIHTSRVHITVLSKHLVSVYISSTAET